MKKNKSKRIIIGSFITVAILGIYGFLLTLGSHDEIYADISEGRLGTMPLSGTPLMATLAPGLEFKIDTGADASSITEADLAKLEALGYKAERMIYPVIGRNGLGQMNCTLTRYRVDVPLYDYTFDIDSLGNTIPVMEPTTLNVLHNVDFVPSSTGFSVLGVDFLQKFKIEYLFDEKAVSLYFDVPNGYEPFADLTVSHSPIKDLWQGNRYYIAISVQNIVNEYFLDTGLQRAVMRLPLSEHNRTTNDLTQDTLLTMVSKHTALIDMDAWVCIGDRCGTASVWYCDALEEPYTFNPFNYMKQDFLLDLDNRKILLHPFTSAITHNRQ
ncbi:MAG: retroviral-like aspartic protease family protein [Paramuribaculum sp.]|nr:retroviral-like aspartic protease family protein [Paramuribaculum sp.]